MSSPRGLSEKDLATLHAAIDALPPLSDEQLDSIAELLVEIRLGEGAYVRT